MFMSESREVLEKYVPGLDNHLDSIGLETIEKFPPNELAALIRHYRLPSLWIPDELGGSNINAYDGIRIQRAIGSRSPSMAIMLAMHNFTVSFCSALKEFLPPCADMLRRTAQESLLIASAFAEGRYGAGILDSSVYVTRNADGTFIINGTKKPCSMTHCMDIITLGIAEKLPDGSKRTGMAILPAHLSGISRHHFWETSVLAASDSHELRFENVIATQEQVLISNGENPDEQELISNAETLGLCCFELIATASYLGIVSALVERSLFNARVDASERARLGCDIEAAQASLDGAVRMMQQSVADQALLAKILLVRFGVQRQIEQSALLASELSGGLDFVTSNTVALLFCASRCLAFHPITRKAAEPMLANFLAGI